MACDAFPDWGSLAPDGAAEDLTRLLGEAEKGVAAVEASEPQTFEDLEWRLSDATRPLWERWGMVAHMTSVMNSDAWRKVEETFQPKLVEFSLRVGQSCRLYEHAKNVLSRMAPGDAVQETRKRIQAIADELGLDQGLALNLNLALEEAVTNVILYAYPKGSDGLVDVEAVLREHSLEFIISDSGAPFDPTAAPEADVTLTAEERPIGGLGIYLVRQLMDVVRYDRQGDKNVLTMIKKL